MKKLINKVTPYQRTQRRISSPINYAQLGGDDFLEKKEPCTMGNCEKNPAPWETVIKLIIFSCLDIFSRAFFCFFSGLAFFWWLSGSGFSGTGLLLFFILF